MPAKRPIGIIRPIVSPQPPLSTIPREASADGGDYRSGRHSSKFFRRLVVQLRRAGEESLTGSVRTGASFRPSSREAYGGTGRGVGRAPGVSFLNMAEQIASSHHEWFNGAGYPAGLLGEQIPLAARITAVADVYDAVTTKRPYKEPFSHERACKIITDSSGKQFDPDVVEAFVATECEFRKLAAELGDSSSCDNDTAETSAAVPSVAGAPSRR